MGGRWAGRWFGSKRMIGMAGGDCCVARDSGGSKLLHQ